MLVRIELVFPEGRILVPKYRFNILGVMLIEWVSSDFRQFFLQPLVALSKHSFTNLALRSMSFARSNFDFTQSAGSDPNNDMPFW